jgi:hypothetical protein
MENVTVLDLMVPADQFPKKTILQLLSTIK